MCYPRQRLGEAPIDVVRADEIMQVDPHEIIADLADEEECIHISGPREMFLWNDVTESRLYVLERDPEGEWYPSARPCTQSFAETSIGNAVSFDITTKMALPEGRHPDDE